MKGRLAMKYTANYIGKKTRLQRIMGKDNKCLIVPLDDNLISGTQTGIESIINKLEQIEKVKPNAIMAYQGTLSEMEDFSIPKILNLSASTIRRNHTKKVLVSDVEYALKMGADAVAVHVNVSSQYESEMLETLGKTSEICDIYGMPLLVIIYPRREKVDSVGNVIDDNYLKQKESNNVDYQELVCHCVRIAFEMGADIIKTQYTGSTESFSNVVKSANDCPVIIAGGPIMEIKEFFKMVEDSIFAGAAGVSIGRNIFSRSRSDIIIPCIKDIIYKKSTYEQVLLHYEQEVLNNS